MTHKAKVPQLMHFDASSEGDYQDRHILINIFLCMTQIVMPGSAAVATPGNVLEMQTLESHSRSNDLETLRVAPRTLCTDVKDADARPNRRMGPAPHSPGNYSAPGLSSSRLAQVSF